MVMAGCVWSAKNAGREYLAQAYARYDEVTKECEVGGLMVSEKARNKGLGLTMMSLALAHSLVEENILSIEGVKVVAHVLRDNAKPRSIIQNHLKFSLLDSVEIPSHVLPGLKADPDGMIRGDEFGITIPDTLDFLIKWSSEWKPVSATGDALDIDFRRGMDMADWSRILTGIRDDALAAMTPNMFPRDQET
jgi:hypothetical protein